MEREILTNLIEQARQRLAAHRAWQWGGRAAAAASGLALLIILARMLLPIEVPYGWLVGLGLAAGALVAAVVRFTSRPSPLLAAQILDYRFKGADRLATAVEILTGRHAPTALTAAAVDDAAHMAMGLDLRSALPARPDRTLGLAAVLAVAGIVAGAGLTGYSLPGTPARQVAMTIQREGRRLERTGQTLEERARADRARITRRGAPSIRRLGETLQRDRLLRSEALARIQSLGKQFEEEQRQVRSRRTQATGERAEPKPSLPSELFQQRAAVDRTVRQIRELADRLAQSRSPEERESLMRQVAALAGGGDEGNVPARARQQAAEANQQLAAGDTAGARRTLQQAAQDLDDLRAMLADEEGLQQAQRDLQRSADQIGGVRPGESPEPEQPPQAAAQQGPVAPGNRPLPQGRDPQESEAPPGPNGGTLPGQGTVTEKLGAQTPRIQGARSQSRVQGQQSEGRVTITELQGPGRRAQVRLPAGTGVTAVRAEADRYMSRMRIPPEYREIVRRYFEMLAARR